MKIPRFLILSSLIMITLIMIAFLVSQYWLPDISFPAMMIGILINFVTGSLAYILTYTGLDKSTRKFTAFLVTGMFTKMMIGIIIVLIVVIEFKPVIKEYVTAYFLTYFIFTAFEVYGLMRKLRA